MYFVDVFSMYFVRLTIRYPQPQKIHGQKKNTQTEMGDDEFSFTSVYFNVFFRGRDKILLLCLVFLVNLFTNKTTFATFALSVFSFIAIANNDMNTITRTIPAAMPGYSLLPATKRTEDDKDKENVDDLKRAL